MKKFFLCSTFICFSYLAFAQIGSLSEYNQKRLKTTQSGMLVLGTWALGNMAAGALRMGATEGEDRYFHQMNLGWGAVNLAIAGFGYYGAMKTDPSSFDLYQSIAEQHKIQKILLFNAGLDVGYMMGGLFMMERAKNVTENAERWKGFGKSILMQGAFLFAFDVAMAVIISKGNGDVRPLLGSLRFTGDGMGLVFLF